VSRTTISKEARVGRIIIKGLGTGHAGPHTQKN